VILSGRRRVGRVARPNLATRRRRSCRLRHQCVVDSGSGARSDSYHSGMLYPKQASRDGRLSHGLVLVRRLHVRHAPCVMRDCARTLSPSMACCATVHAPSRHRPVHGGLSAAPRPPPSDSYHQARSDSLRGMGPQAQHRRAAPVAATVHSTASVAARVQESMYVCMHIYIYIYIDIYIYIYIDAAGSCPCTRSSVACAQGWPSREANPRAVGADGAVGCAPLAGSGARSDSYHSQGHHSFNERTDSAPSGGGIRILYIASGARSDSYHSLRGITHSMSAQTLHRRAAPVAASVHSMVRLLESPHPSVLRGANSRLDRLNIYIYIYI
jgi:hypothetical protein